MCDLLISLLNALNDLWGCYSCIHFTYILKFLLVHLGYLVSFLLFSLLFFLSLFPRYWDSFYHLFSHSYSLSLFIFFLSSEALSYPFLFFPFFFFFFNLIEDLTGRFPRLRNPRGIRLNV